MKTFLTLVTLASIGLALSVPAHAAGSAEAARSKVSMCIGCHGIPLYRTVYPEVYHVPKIAGQSREYIVKALQAYKTGDRSHPGMTGIVRGLSDADMADLAAYYAAQSPRVRPQVVDAAKAAEGKRLADAHHCTACHRQDLSGQHHVPRVAGQDLEYLLRLLRAYKAQTMSDLDGFMTAAAQPLTDAEMESLAHYMATLPAPPSPR